MRKILKRIAVFLVFIIGTSNSKALMCTGPVSGVSVNIQTGSVLAASVAGLNFPVLCSTSSTVNNIPPANCSKFFATLLTAQVTKKTITLYFSQGDSCSSFKAWELAPTFYHYTLND
ncbi:hypothetical protein ACG95N_13905 [Acinetobacter guillouiae]|uniref:hypothetical protein n=1 Tax=Acinetobacter guillouiae TaxID=106649 RepID=UPI003AF6B497